MLDVEVRLAVLRFTWRRCAAGRAGYADCLRATRRQRSARRRRAAGRYAQRGSTASTMASETATLSKFDGDVCEYACVLAAMSTPSLRKLGVPGLGNGVPDVVAQVELTEGDRVASGVPDGLGDWVTLGVELELGELVALRSQRRAGGESTC